MYLVTLFRLNQVATLVLLAVGLLASSSVRAQAPQPTMQLFGDKPTDATYDGPRFAGGPDSLRAVLERTVRQASPALTEQQFVRVELTNAGQLAKLYYLTPTTKVAMKQARSPEAQALAQQLASRLATWQPSAKPKDASDTGTSSFTIPLALGSVPKSTALLYCDEHPAFPFPAGRNGRNTPNAMSFVVMQVRYPVEDLRNRVQGKVYAYFEVSETGAIEQRRIAGSVSPTLDAEALRVLQTLPNAVSPPRYQGQPVRVAYVLPINFSIR
jgi:protein TonB